MALLINFVLHVRIFDVRNLYAVSCLAALAFASGLAGCSHRGDRPDLGEVEGVITINGQPAEGLQVVYYQKGFPESLGVTDASGKYQLKYVRDVPGAAVGEHEVRIRRVPMPGEKRPQLPARYNRHTDLIRKVEPGLNKFDFELKTKED